MKKRIGLLLLLILVMAALCSPAYADTGVGIEPGDTMPDFTVSLTDGSTATLSEVLKEKDLVVLNIFASWCPPCEREFPEMEAVYQEKKDQMEIIAVSGDPEDTMEIMTDYKAGHSLSFPMGLAGDALDFLSISAFPTTIFIDKNGKVGMVKIGAFMDRAEFEEKIGHFLAKDYEGDPLEFEKAFNIVPYLLGWVALSALMLVVGRWGILKKAGKKGWHSLIPFFNVYEEYDTVWNGWLGLVAGLCVPLSFIAAISELPGIVATALRILRWGLSIPESLKLAKAFGKGKVFGFLMFLPVFREVGRLILGVGKARYQQL